MSLRSLAQAFLESQKAQVSQRDIPRGVPAGQMAVSELKTYSYGVPASVPGGTVANKHSTSGTSVPLGTVQRGGTNGTVGTLGTVGTSGTVNWVLLQAKADKRNIKAQRDRLTDRYCRCGRLAECAWPLDSRREMWRCNRCLDTSGNA